MTSHGASHPQTIGMWLIFRHGRPQTIGGSAAHFKTWRPQTIGVLLIFRHGRPQTIGVLLIFRHGRPQAIGVLLIFSKNNQNRKKCRNAAPKQQSCSVFCNTLCFLAGFERKCRSVASKSCFWSVFWNSSPEFAESPESPEVVSISAGQVLPRAPIGQDDRSLSKLPPMKDLVDVCLG